MQFRSDLLEPVKASLLLTISKPLDSSKIHSFSFIVFLGSCAITVPVLGKMLKWRGKGNICEK